MPCAQELALDTGRVRGESFTPSRTLKRTLQASKRILHHQGGGLEEGVTVSLHSRFK